MLDDFFDLPGFDDLVDLLDSLADLFDFDGSDLADLDQPVMPMWASPGGGVDFADPAAFWSGLDAPPLDAGSFGYEFGNMQFHNPFAGGLTSQIQDGSYDDFIVRSALNTGIPLEDFPN